MDDKAHQDKREGDGETHPEEKPKKQHDEQRIQRKAYGTEQEPLGVRQRPGSDPLRRQSVLCIDRESDKQRYKKNNLKEERTPEGISRSAIYRHEEEKEQHEVFQTNGGKAAQLFRHQPFQQGQKR
jgi:hypothetical protein